MKPYIALCFVVVQSSSHVRLFATPWTVACQLPLSSTIFLSLLKFMSTESMMPSNHLIYRPLLLLPSIFPNIRIFSSESALLVRLPKYWSFSFSISPSNEYSRLTSFRIDWFDLLVVQVTLKSLLQHCNSKASILQCLAFFIVQMSHPYMTIGTTVALVIWIFVSKVMSLLFSMLSWFVIAFLPRNKRVLISRLQLLSAVILEPPKIKSVIDSIVFPSICCEVMKPLYKDLNFPKAWLSLSSPLCLSACTFLFNKASQVALMVKNLFANAEDIRDPGLIPELGRSPGEGLGNPIQYSCLENPMDGGAWRAVVHWVTNSRTGLSDLSTVSLPEFVLD